MTRSGTGSRSIRYLPIALVSLGSVVAACTANQPPPTPAYPIVATYPPPPHRPARPHNRNTVPQTRDAARQPPEAAPGNPAPAGEPVALLAAPSATAPEISGAGLGETQEALPAPSPTDLTGMDQARATKLLGPAIATESRGPATVWHYKSSRCELDLVFYMEMRSGEMRSLHQDFKGINNPQQRQACLRAIIQENSRSAATTP